MYIKKFFDADATEVASAPPAETQSFNPLSALASAGRLNISGGEMDDVPEYNPQPQTETTEAEAPAVTANEQAEVAAPEAQVETPQEVVDEPVSQVEQVQEQPQVSWQEIIKKEATETVLKELGFDEKVVGFLNHWKSGGDVQEYLKEMATDYSKMPAEDVMKHQLRLEFPKATERQLQLLYEEEVVNKYKIDPEVYSEDEVERGRLLLEARAEKYRDTLVERQQKFLLPPAPINEPPASNNNDAEMQVIGEAKRSVLESPIFRQVLSNNKLTIGEGDEAFSFPVNANELPDIIYDSEKFLNSLFTVENGKDGNVKLKADPEKQLLVAAVAKYGKQLFVEYAKHYKAVGGRKAIDPIENPSTPNNTQGAKVDAQNLSPAAALAKMGRLGG